MTMSKKSVEIGPAEHDRLVRREALKLLADGFRVYARLGKWFQEPETIYGYKPDIDARKGEERIVIEIAKGAIDWPKTSALERYAHENPDVQVTIFGPDGQINTTDASRSADAQQRFIIAVAKLLGVNPTETSLLHGALLCNSWLLDEITNAILSPAGNVKLTLEQFNRLLVNCRRPIATPHFFNHFFSDVQTISDFEEAVESYRRVAMLLFGNFKFAYKLLATCDAEQFRKLLSNASPKDITRYKSRSPFTEIRDIEDDDLCLLGYLSAEHLDDLLFCEAVLTDAVDNSSAGSVLRNVTPEQRVRIAEVIGEAVLTAAAAAGDGKRIASECLANIRKETETLVQRQEKARDVGRKNTERYLSLPYMDVYIATSMRDKSDFIEQRRFVRELFGDEALGDLNLRYFDPTLSYVDDRVTKGLIECLMLQRAAITVYNAGAKDTMGKDSELAATLAQGKPVIVFVPDDSALDGRAEGFRLAHPLGLQIDHDSGVAHGIVVVRTPEQCAQALRSLLLRTYKTRIVHQGGNYLLEETTTHSVIRVVTDNSLLTHAFWTYFRDALCPDEVNTERKALSTTAGSEFA